MILSILRSGRAHEGRWQNFHLKRLSSPQKASGPPSPARSQSSPARSQWEPRSKPVQPRSMCALPIHDGARWPPQEVQPSDLPHLVANSFEDHRWDTMQQLAAFDVVAARERAQSCDHSSPLSRYGSEAPPAIVLCCERKLGVQVCVLCRFRTHYSATSSETSSPTGSRPLRRSSRWPLPDASAGEARGVSHGAPPLAPLRSSCCCASPCSARSHNM